MIGALTAFKGAAREQAVESAREGIKSLSEKIGTWAGAGVAAGGAAVAEAIGHRPTPMIAVGAAGIGMWLGGLAGRAMNAGLNRITTANSTSPISTVMTELATVLQTLEQVNRHIGNIIDSINKAQTRIQKISRGQGNNLLNNAARAYRKAPTHFEEGITEIKEAQKLTGTHLVTIATAGG